MSASTAAFSLDAEGAAAPSATARKEDAAEVLSMVLGAEVVAALHEGFAKGGDFTAVVPLLVGPGAKPYLAAATRAALATACDAGQAGVAALLLEADGVRAKDANVPSTRVDEHGQGGFTLLSAAADRGDLAVVRALSRSGKADANSAGRREAGGQGNLPLMLAVYTGCTAVVAELLAAPGIDVDRLDRIGGTTTTALSEAARLGETACLAALLRAGGYPNTLRGNDWATPIMLAVKFNHAACVRLLLADEDTDVNQIDNRGETVLMQAVVAKQPGVVRALLEMRGVNANHSCDDGWTALSQAAADNQFDCMRALLGAVRRLNHSAAYSKSWLCGAPMRRRGAPAPAYAWPASRPPALPHSNAPPVAEPTGVC